LEKDLPGNAISQIIRRSSIGSFGKSVKFLLAFGDRSCCEVRISDGCGESVPIDVCVLRGIGEVMMNYARLFFEWAIWYDNRVWYGVVLKWSRTRFTVALSRYAGRD
jgi:hypothetical protein